MDNRLLEVKDLHVSFRNKKGSIPVLRGVNFTLEKGKVLCIVGESGSGKSLTSLAIMGLLPEAAEVPAGEINFNGENLVGKSMREMSKIRGNDISMIFQEPMTSLNPVHTIGKQISEPLRVHQKLG